MLIGDKDGEERRIGGSFEVNQRMDDWNIGNWKDGGKR